jgi:hypothetical protein
LRLTIYIATIFIAALLSEFRLLINPVHITGHLKINPQETSAYVNGIAVIVKGGKKTLAHTFADSQGNFEATLTVGKEKSFDFFCFGVGIDTMLFGSVRTFNSDKPDLTFYIPALRKKNLLGQMFCPKCNKADKVYKIVYGDAMPIKIEVSENGDTTYSNIVNGHFNAGTCLVGVPKYFCDRDKVKF